MLLGVGLLCIVAAPLLAPLPGPGGIPLFLVGLTLLLRYTRRAKKLYVRAKKRWPKHGDWADWGLRRASAKRRAALAKREDG